VRGCEVVDAGPISYSSIEVAGDPLDLETALRDDDLDPPQTSYRLIEIPLDAVNVFPWLSKWLAEGYGAETVEALRRDDTFPPVVGRVVGEKFVLIDGVHRLIACVALGHNRVRAYDLLA
jgi:hypothetical protein